MGALRLEQEAVAGHAAPDRIMSLCKGHWEATEAQASLSMCSWMFGLCIGMVAG